MDKKKDIAKPDLGRSTSSEPAHEGISLLAYQIWKEKGCPDGRHIEHWLQAEVHILQARKKLAPVPASNDRAGQNTLGTPSGKLGLIEINPAKPGK